MKISAINQNTKTNFNGLWGYTKQKTKFNQKTGLLEIKEEKTYHPFADEDKKEVQEFVIGRTFTHDDYCSRTKCITKTGKTLPFTEAQYWDYRDIQSIADLSEKEWDIHYYTQGLYLTSESKNQEPAVNLNLEI